jgi:hypothetical protein
MKTAPILLSSESNCASRVVGNQALHKRGYPLLEKYQPCILLHGLPRTSHSGYMAAGLTKSRTVEYVVTFQCDVLRYNKDTLSLGRLHPNTDDGHFNMVRW